MKVGHSPSIGNAVRSLLFVNMGLKEREKLFVIGDTAGDGGDLAREVGRIAAGLHPGTETLLFDPVGGHGQEPPRPVWEATLGREAVRSLDEEGILGPLLSKNAPPARLSRALELLRVDSPDSGEVVVAITRFSISHTSFRKLLTEARHVRFASMPLFERDMFFGPMNVDWVSMAHFTRVLGRSPEGADR